MVLLKGNVAHACNFAESNKCIHIKSIECVSSMCTLHRVLALGSKNRSCKKNVAAQDTSIIIDISIYKRVFL